MGDACNCHADAVSWIDGHYFWMVLSTLCVFAAVGMVSTFRGIVRRLNPWCSAPGSAHSSHSTAGVVVAESPAALPIPTAGGRRLPDLVGICGHGKHYHFHEKCPSFSSVALKDSSPNFPMLVEHISKEFNTNNTPHAKGLVHRAQVNIQRNT